MSDLYRKPMNTLYRNLITRIGVIHAKHPVRDDMFLCGAANYVLDTDVAEVKDMDEPVDCPDCYRVKTVCAQKDDFLNTTAGPF